MSKLDSVRIKVPVNCHNGHVADYYMKLEDLTWISEGVPKDQDCDCCKWGKGKGWTRRKGTIELIVIGAELPA